MPLSIDKMLTHFKFISYKSFNEFQQKHYISCIYRIRGIFYTDFNLPMNKNRKIKNFYNFAHVYVFNV